MKKLILASRGTFITDGQYDIFDKPKNEIKWAHIITAGNSVPNKTYLIKHRERLTELGWDFEEIDIAGQTPNELRDILKDKDAINMVGGNSFYLLKSIRESGFKEVLDEFLERGGVYCGASAGSYVCCPTIEMAGLKDPKKFDHHGVTDLTAMNLVPFLIIAHYTKDFESLVEQLKVKTKYEVKILTDQQAIKVVDDKIELIEDPNIESKDFGG
ncbi:Type 1 glutamine amidotransferase-like domain-containing protein [Patescibacteria group bacterium]